MKKMIGYMVTWTTYGSWLQGDERGYVKAGEILGANRKLESANQRQQKFPKFRLNLKQKQIVEKTIKDVAKKINQKIFAIVVCSNHVHIVAEVSKDSIEQVVHRYKYSATVALRGLGTQGRIWSKGFNKKFCFTGEEIKSKIIYVQNHDNE